MNWIIGTLLVLFSVAGGSWGWGKGTRDLANPPERYDRRSESGAASMSAAYRTAIGCVGTC